MDTPPLFYPKDFIETAEGLLFAVVAHGIEDGKVLCFLRYVLEDSGWKKYPTHAANTHLQAHHPHYLHFSTRLAADLHAVAIEKITKHYQPRSRLAAIMQTSPDNAVEQDVYQLGRLLQQHGLDLANLGVTGSILAGVQNAASDIDLVCYDRTTFQLCRTLVRDLIALGKLADLTETDWQQSYQRREADLSYEEYRWHERRKHNKALINGRKFDLSLLNVDDGEEGDCQKLAAITVQCQIIDDTYGFDYPARFVVDHPTIQTIISFTATYIGQAFTGEWVEVSGILEQTAKGLQRIVVGSNREARGEYIKVKR
ncbi:MAG: hypothetical protein PHH59_03700 [Methylovulum sp.]|uniref:hypothetical protein n=1 Tax=Methylovulum sp. TaxID=1916980 RepID=UPI002633C025|nr:hypothetical protein [Methylovulum sp.]MDD2723112.1 hypothetical protein [Methylovulum sp.]MDD5123578.1 hypothetical protein [Methylovulum sp.]